MVVTNFTATTFHRNDKHKKVTYSQNVVARLGMYELSGEWFCWCVPTCIDLLFLNYRDPILHHSHGSMVFSLRTAGFIRSVLVFRAMNWGNYVHLWVLFCYAWDTRWKNRPFQKRTNEENGENKALNTCRWIERTKGKTQKDETRSINLSPLIST